MFFKSNNNSLEFHSLNCNTVQMVLNVLIIYHNIYCRQKLTFSGTIFTPVQISSGKN